MIAIPLVVAVAGGAIGVTSIVAGSVRSFTRDIGQYEHQLDGLTAQLAAYGHRVGIDLTDTDLSDLLAAAVMGLWARRSTRWCACSAAPSSSSSR
ncbi:MAG: hypothetical protein R3F59_10015 [Myxococcota bacterium]